MVKYPTLGHIIEKIEDSLNTSLSVSMFNKDMAGMKRIYNAPIQYDHYNKGYYYADENFSIKKFPLTSQEIEALDFSTALLNQLKGTAMLEQFENAINKVIEGYRISKYLGKSEKQILQVEGPIKTEANKWLEIILKAILNKGCLDIVYKVFNKEQKTHEFSPYLLKEYHNRWYAVGFSKNAGEVRIFALDRIQDIKTTTKKYHPEDGFKSDDFFKYSLGVTQISEAAPETVVLSFTTKQAPYIISQPLHPSQKLVLENEAEVRVQMELFLTPELIMVILSYGPEVKVMAPEKLKDQIVAYIEKMRLIYC